MAKYQDPNFNKRDYWGRREASLKGQSSLSARGSCLLVDGHIPYSKVGGQPLTKKAQARHDRRVAREAAIKRREFKPEPPIMTQGQLIEWQRKRLPSDLYPAGRWLGSKMGFVMQILNRTVQAKA